MPITLDEARALDAADPLRAHRDAFDLPPGLIYLDGNSLGPPPRAALARLAEVAAREWGGQLIAGWDRAGWMAAPARIGDAIARIVGAGPGEVLAADSTSVNLFKLLSAAVRLRPDRRVILTEAGNFPTDRHVADGLAALRPGLEVRAVPAEAISGALGEDTAVLLLCHVHYRSGARHDMRALTAQAHAHGALAVWDLSHSAGAVPVDLNGARADMAVGCGYKFLNGGPGAPAFLFVAARHQGAAQPAPQGWMGHADPFAFSDIYAPAPGLARFLTGTPGVLGLAALEAGVAAWLAADLAALFEKSARLFDMFAALCPALELLTPRDAALRGSQISFRHANARAIMQRLAARGIIGDYRPPDIMRFGLTPLYTRYAEIFSAAEAVKEEAVLF